MKADKYLELLGLKAEDKVTGFKGVIDSVSFDLYGCIQVVIRPPAGEKGELKNGQWFDVGRLKITGKRPVIAVPDFKDGPVAEGKKGAADKPSFKSM